jgi:hypothetical protein
MANKGFERADRQARRTQLARIVTGLSDEDGATLSTRWLNRAAKTFTPARKA